MAEIIDPEELEKEQLDYLLRNSADITVRDTTETYPDALKNPLMRPVVLDREQQAKIVEEVKRQINVPQNQVIKSGGFSIGKYFDILSVSFIDIMDDLLNFDGDMEQIPSIFTKDERLVLVGTVIMLISIYIIVLNKK
jgi:hypothetical protein